MLRASLEAGCPQAQLVAVPFRCPLQVVHRLAVFEAHGEITNIVSQTDVMRFLLSRVDELGPVANQSLEELGMLTGWWG